MPTSPPFTTLGDALREAIRASGLSYSRLARLAKLDSGTISHFMVGERDMTLGVASRLCAVLGYGLTKIGEAVNEPLADPPKTNRDPKVRKPASAVKRGRGRRVDLETKEELGESRGKQRVGSATEKIATTPPPTRFLPATRGSVRSRSRSKKA